MSLNRTSVGLKPNATHEETRPSLAPQSNQRGIETQPGGDLDSRDGQSLNRTSVGLKPLFRSANEGAAVCLNRTSVGLKLLVGLTAGLGYSSASIEPAWD